MQTQSESSQSSASTTRVEPGLLGTFDQLAQQRDQLDQLRAERDRLLDRQRQIAELLQCKNSDKLLHDLRNVLNELQLYKMLVETQAKKA